MISALQNVVVSALAFVERLERRVYFGHQRQSLYGRVRVAGVPNLDVERGQFLAQTLGGKLNGPVGRLEECSRARQAEQTASRVSVK